MFWVTTANYIDRGVFANLAPELQTRIGWTQEQYWNMQVVFQAAYAVSNLMAGRLMDVMGLRWGFTVACAFWGLAACFRASGRGLAATRAGVGAGGLVANCAAETLGVTG